MKTVTKILLFGGIVAGAIFIAKKLLKKPVVMLDVMNAFPQNDKIANSTPIVFDGKYIDTAAFTKVCNAANMFDWSVINGMTNFKIPENNPLSKYPLYKYFNDSEYCIAVPVDVMNKVFGDKWKKDFERNNTALEARLNRTAYPKTIK